MTKSRPKNFKTVGDQLEAELEVLKDKIKCIRITSSFKVKGMPNTELEVMDHLEIIMIQITIALDKDYKINISICKIQLARVIIVAMREVIK